MILPPRRRATVRPFASSNASVRAPGATGMRRLGDAIGAWFRRRARKRRERRIIAAFARSHPRWHASLFDAPFLATGEARGAIEALDAERLALAWTRQFGHAGGETRRRDVRTVARVAADFLNLVDAERRLG